MFICFFNFHRAQLCNVVPAVVSVLTATIQDLFVFVLTHPLKIVGAHTQDWIFDPEMEPARELFKTLQIASNM